MIAYAMRLSRAAAGTGIDLNQGARFSRFRSQGFKLSQSRGRFGEALAVAVHGSEFGKGLDAAKYGKERGLSSDRINGASERV